MFDVPVVLNRDSEEPLNVQLAAQLRAAIVTGALRVGDKLPSTRRLADDLGISRTVTAAAYDQLMGEGWLHARQGSGTFVDLSPTNPEDSQGISRPPSSSPSLGYLLPGAACLDLLDQSIWRRAWRGAADRPSEAWPEPIGDLLFRSEICHRFLRPRGLKVAPSDVLATSGTSSVVGEMAKLFGPGAIVAVENPGFIRAVGAFEAHGVKCAAVPVDDEGIVVDEIPEGVVAVYCTPAHQFPVGSRMSVSRRLALVERARNEGFWVLEDDYDGELRYSSRGPLPLIGSIGPEVVAHLGTTSKIVGATLGAGWIVAPPELHERLLDARVAAGYRPPRAGQRVFAELLRSGDLSRHIKVSRTKLRARRGLVDAAVEAMGMHTVGDPAGGHVLLRLQSRREEEELIAAAQNRNLGLHGLADYSIEDTPEAGIVLGFTNCSTDELEFGLKKLASAVSSLG